MKIKIRQYVSERSDVLKKSFNCINNILFVAPPDSGKTRYIILDYAQSNPHKKIAVVVPYITLVDNLKRKYDRKTNGKTVFGTGKDFIKEAKHSNCIITTYDSFLLADTSSFDVIFIDESHIIASHGNFRAKTLSRLLDVKCKKVLLTGTPDLIELLSGYESLVFTRKDFNKEINIVESKTKAVKYAHTLIQNRDRNKLTIIRILSKNDIDDLFEQFHDVPMAKIYSEKDFIRGTGQDEEVFKKIKEGTVPQSVEVLLTTSVLDAGISLEVYRNVDIYAIAGYYEGMPNPVDMIQLYHRIRSSSKFNITLTVVGMFGENKLDEAPIVAPTSNQLVNRLAERYEEFSCLDREDYPGLLDHYQFRTNIKREIEQYKYYEDIAYISNSKLIKIAKNFNSLSLFDDLKDIFSSYNISDQLKYVTGDEKLRGKESSKIHRVYNIMVDCAENNIHMSFLINGQRFEQEKTKLLLDAVNLYKYDESYRYFFNQLAKGTEKKVGDKIRFSYDKKFMEMNKTERKSIRVVSKLLYKGRIHEDVNRHSVGLTRKENSEWVKNYIYWIYDK